MLSSAVLQAKPERGLKLGWTMKCSVGWCLRSWLAAVLVLTAPCLAQPGHRKWPLIEDERASRLQSMAQSMAVTYARPVEPINRVWICYWGGSGHPNRCSADPGAYGEYTLFLDHKPGAYAFPGSVAHETFHLLNAHLIDAYMEGMCDCFSEDFCQANRFDWSRWPPYLEKQSPAYAHTYQMMKAIRQVVGDNCFAGILAFAVATPGTRDDQHIDINAWLQTIPLDKRSRVVQIIQSHASAIERYRLRNCHFELPRP